MEIESKQLVVIKRQVDEASRISQELVVKNQPQLEEAKILSSKIRAVKKFLKADKDEVVKPIEEGLKKFKARYAPLEEIIEGAEKLVDSKMLNYDRVLQAEEEKRRLALEEEARKLAEEEAKKKPKEVEITKAEVKVEKAVEKVEVIIEKREAIPTRKNPVVKIVDENKVPDKYWVLDMVAIRRDAVTNKMEIPGVKVVIEETIIHR